MTGIQHRSVRRVERRFVVVALATAVLVATQLMVVLPAAAKAAPSGAVPGNAPAQAPLLNPTSKITLAVKAARTELNAVPPVTKGTPVIDYKWMVNLDNTGQTIQRDAAPGSGCSTEDAGYPNDCRWASIAGLRTSAPVVAQGDATALNGALGVTLPAGRYLISVLADGYKLDGIHFTIPLEAPGLVTVPVQPLPLPAATIKAQVFADVTSANGQYDPGEDGLSGFSGKITDYIGQVNTDVFGNPLCTRYAPGTGPNGYEWVDGGPVVEHLGGKCLSGDINMDGLVNGPASTPGTDEAMYVSLGLDPVMARGVVTIPNLGPNRYALAMVPPTGSSWVQTTTLEGNHDWDAWVMEGSTGLDTEFVVAGEAFPATIFGYVPGTSSTYWDLPAHKFAAGGAGTISGLVASVKVNVPATGGLALPGTIWGGLSGAKVDKPIDKPWITVSDLGRGDTAVWSGQGASDGTFTIPNVPDGSYMLTYWDEAQNYMLDLINVTVVDGEAVDLGVLPLAGWFTSFDGYIFNDLNRNGKRDAGEPGVPNFGLTLRKRENSLMDRGATAVSTDSSGHYAMENAYPLTEWLVLEAYDDRYYTTGITYQADNQPTPTTVMGQGVDLSVLPIIGLSGRVDWGVHAYDASGANGIDPQNGGIVGSISYDTTRNELDPRYAAAEDWQPGVSGLTVELYATVPCDTHPATPCDAAGDYELAADGSYARGNLLNTYLSEMWERPTGCVARGVDGTPLVHGTDEHVLPIGPNAPCLEGPVMGVQFGPYPTDQGTPDGNFGAAVDGNYGFGDGCVDGILDATDPSAPTCTDGLGGDVPFTPLGADDYLVHIDLTSQTDVNGDPIYKVTREEDINIGNGDSFLPQVPPPACAGAKHTVDVAGYGADGPNATVNPTFVEIGSSPYEGQARPLCDTKLVPLQNGKSVVPMFNVFTDVPLPGRFYAYIVDDLNFSADPKSLLYGEKAGIPFVPVGIYDWANRLVTTVESDYNGVFDVLLPSTNRINCPTPSGVCGNLYNFVGNDPGVPGRLNLNYNPTFRTIAAQFESWPGIIVPADTAPTKVGVTVQVPGGQINQALSCPVNPPGGTVTTPELFAVDKPYADNRVAGAKTVTIRGQGFGATQGAGRVTLAGSTLPVTSWSDGTIVAQIPASTSSGPQQLVITADNGRATTNGLTFHVLGYDSFPDSGIIDDFNRTTIGSNWNTDGVYSLSSPTGGPISTYSVRVTGTGTMRYGGSVAGGPVYGASQEAFFTFAEVSPTASEQGLFLKVTGNGSNPNPTAGPSAYIEVSYKATAPTSVQVRTKQSGTGTIRLQATFGGVTLAAGDQLGARALPDGTVIAYRNGVEVGRVNVRTTANPWPAANAAGGGQLGVRFVGAGNTATNDARFDDFGGGNVTAYTPNLYEVGPGLVGANQFPALQYVEGDPPHPIQDAIDAAATSAGDDLVVVYPGLATPENPRLNPRGAYYENLILTRAVKLQGVGPGSADGSVAGTIIDGSAFGGDTALAEAWRVRLDGMIVDNVPTWEGNPEIYEGSTIYLLADTPTSYGAQFRAAIDGFDLRGGDQQGFPYNINQIGGGATGLPPEAQTQGGAIFANAYVQHLSITNNVVQNNGGTFGTLRIGTPDLPAPLTDNQNDDLLIADNRIVANGGTNLAGAIGIFAGTNGYDVARNDICGNASAEYGGGLTVYGKSPGGRIHHNRVRFNQSYDEGGGIMITGQLPADPNLLSPGTGPVDIYANVIQGNLGNDDGGGLRFLMAGNPPINVYDNVIVNNVSTHEGAGIAIDDAPNLRIYANTIMKNVTTATAVTSNGLPAPAGLSTGANSALLQATLPLGAPTFSDPLLFDNIFWDNRAGTRVGANVTGIGAAGDATTLNHWDMGAADPSILLAPTHSILQVTTGTTPDPTNLSSDPGVAAPWDLTLDFAPWRTNPNFMGAILVAVDLPATLNVGDYHLTTMSPARDAGAASKTVGALTVQAPSTDIDGQERPAFGFFDIGADEIPAYADLSITKTDGQGSITAGDPIAYTIVVANAGPDATHATVADALPATLTGATWTCVGAGGATCNAGGSGNLATSATLPSGGSATYTVNATLAVTATGSLANTATVTAGVGTIDTNQANDGATDTDTVLLMPADLSITKTDGVTSVTAGDQVTYTIVATNLGPNAVTGATLTDTFPASLSVGSWSCAASAGSSCTASGSGNARTGTVTLLNGGTATFTATTTLSFAATGTLANTASVVVPADRADPNAANNNATDTDTIVVPARPTLGLLDSFTGANAVNLGTNWSQPNNNIRRNNNQANNASGATGFAWWNAPSTGFGPGQGAALAVSNSTLVGDSLILKATGGSATAPQNYVRVRLTSTTVVVEGTINSGGAFTTAGTLNNANASVLSADILTAKIDAAGLVQVWRTRSATTVYVGRVQLPNVALWTSGGGRIGMSLPNGARVDDFSGGTLP